jgi:hypothetical protein
VSPDPVSWLMIEPGWTVVDQEGKEVGRVEEVAGDSSRDIFNGLAVAGGLLSRPRYVPAEKVAEIVEGQVRLSVTAAALGRLGEYTEPPPSEQISSERASLAGRIETDIAPPSDRTGRIPLLRRVLLWFGLAGRR